MNLTISCLCPLCNKETILALDLHCKNRLKNGRFCDFNILTPIFYPSKYLKEKIKKHTNPPDFNILADSNLYSFTDSLEEYRYHFEYSLSNPNIHFDKSTNTLVNWSTPAGINSISTIYDPYYKVSFLASGIVLPLTFNPSKWHHHYSNGSPNFKKVKITENTIIDLKKPYGFFI